MDRSEIHMNKYVVDWISSLPFSYAKKRRANDTNRGHPDVTGCSHGIRIEIEGKKGANRPSKIQEKRLREWKAAGAITGVYWSLEEAQAIVLAGLKERGIRIGFNDHKNQQVLLRESVRDMHRRRAT